MQFHSELEAHKNISSIYHVCASYIYAHKRIVMYSYEMCGITKVGNNDPKICNGDNISNSTFHAIISIPTPCNIAGRG